MAASLFHVGAKFSGIKIDVDADNMLARTFTDMERTQLPFAVMQAVNATAFGVRESWQRMAARVFDRPTPMTINAVLYAKATRQRLFATVFIRDEAIKGTPPAKYLLPQVQGGERRPKGMERLLQSAGVMPQGMFAVPGNGAQLDAYGNVKPGQVRQILSQLQSGMETGYTSNESEKSRGRRLKREAKRGGGGHYFPIKQRRGALQPGLYERVTTGFGSGVRSIFVFTRSARYTPRYDIYGLAQRQWNALMPFHFNRELAKALESAKLRGKA